MIWHFINSGENKGKFNMDFDQELARECTPNEAYFRLYKWKPYCISLGANQNFEEINLTKAERDRIDVVKRPTGGRAILHAEEITYSVILPVSFSLSAKEIYQKISLALIKGLSLYDSILSELELEEEQPNFPQILKQPTGALCFGSTAKNEVKYKGKKLIGSAQRKMNSVILQHGSILCGSFHRKLADYINANNSDINTFRHELENKTIELKAVTGKEVKYNELIDCLVKGFSEVWQIDFTSSFKENPF